ncbi:MAG: tyrosine-type recombinase/integrase [Bacteriovoracia bacterium]
MDQLSSPFYEHKVPELSLLKEQLGQCLDARLDWTQGTRRVFSSLMKRYVEFLGEHQSQSLLKVTSEFVQQKFSSQSSRHLALSAVRAFWNQSFPRELNPTYQLKLPRIDKSAGAAYFTGSEIAILLDYIETNKNKHLRERAVILMLIYSGMRAGELLQLKREDISPEGVVFIRQTKSRKARKLVLPSAALAAVAEYHQVFSSESDYVFFPHDQPNHNAPLSYCALWRAFKKIYSKADLKTSVGLHVFRHSFAMAQTEARIDVDFLQKLLGHSKVSTTQIYRHLYDSEVFSRSKETESAVFNYYSKRRKK